jgi:hypothetical protein
MVRIQGCFRVKLQPIKSRMNVELATRILDPEPQFLLANKSADTIIHHKLEKFSDHAIGALMR